MKQIIGGKRYDTATAIELGSVGSTGTCSGDLEHWSATLYKTPRGRFFLAGRGGPKSLFGRPFGQGGRQGSEGIVPISVAAARTLAEDDLSTEIVETHFDVEEA